MSLWTFSRANPERLFSPMDDLNHVFNLLKAEKLLSAEATLTGNVTRIWKKMNIFKNIFVTHF